MFALLCVPENYYEGEHKVRPYIVSRTIFHLDLDAFYCAVEQLFAPEFVGQTFAIGGDPSGRGVIASPSYPARAFGVRSAMPAAQALRLCPHLKLIRPNMARYKEFSRRVMAIFRDYSPILEQLSVDEAFLDVSEKTNAFSARLLAWEIQEYVRETTQLSVSIGIAQNKLVAKIASEHAKPAGVFQVKPGFEQAFLAPLSVRELWGVGPQNAKRLNDKGITTIGDLQQTDPARLEKIFGKLAIQMVQRANGIDFRPVETQRETKSVSSETTFSQNVEDAAILTQTLRELCDDVARRLEKNGLHGRVAHLKIRFADFQTLTRQTALPDPTQNAAPIFEAALELLKKNWKGQPLRLLGVGVSKLETGVQPSLF